MSIDKNSRAARQIRSRGKRAVRKKKKRVSVWKVILIAIVLLVVGAAASAIWYLHHLWNLTADLDVNMEEIMVNPNLDIQTETVQKGFWKVAVFGVDSTDGNLGRGANSDVIIICSVNRETGEIKLASVYRDTYLKVGEKNPYRKINEAYARGGPEQALKALNENLDIAVDDFVAVNWKAVADGINNLGGVDIEITEAEFRQINGYITSVVENTGVYSQHLKAPGFQHLDGVQAVAYCRLRKMDTDFQRTQRQREVISQCLEKAKHADLKVLHSLIGVCLPQVAHSFLINDLLDIAKGINRYYLSDTVGFPFDLKVQDIGKLDCVVPDTLESNVIKLHQFLFGTEDYQPSEQVAKISKDIAYNSAKQADTGEELRQADIEKMTSSTRDSEERREESTKESTSSASTEASSSTEAEESSRIEETSSEAEESEGESLDREIEESSSTTEPTQTEGQDPNHPIRTEVPERTEEESPGPGNGPSAPTTEENMGPGSSPHPNESSSNAPVEVVPEGPGTGATVHTSKPTQAETEPTGIEGGPGFFQ